jgi:hypothetical protein
MRSRNNRFGSFKFTLAMTAHPISVTFSDFGMPNFYKPIWRVLMSWPLTLPVAVHSPQSRGPSLSAALSVRVHVRFPNRSPVV